MKDALLKLLAFATLCAFLGILAVEVGRLDLYILAGITLALVAFDFFIRRAR